MLANFVTLMDAGDLNKVVESFADGSTAASWLARDRRRKQPEGEWGSETTTARLGCALVRVRLNSGLVDEYPRATDLQLERVGGLLQWEHRPKRCPRSPQDQQHPRRPVLTTASRPPAALAPVPVDGISE